MKQAKMTGASRYESAHAYALKWLKLTLIPSVTALAAGFSVMAWLKFLVLLTESMVLHDIPLLAKTIESSSVSLFLLTTGSVLIAFALSTRDFDEEGDLGEDSVEEKYGEQCSRARAMALESLAQWKEGAL